MSDGIWSIPRSPTPIFPHTLIDNNKNSSRKIDNFMANYWRQTTILQWFELTPCGISIIIGQVLFFSFLYFTFQHPDSFRNANRFSSRSTRKSQLSEQYLLWQRMHSMCARIFCKKVFDFLRFWAPRTMSSMCPSPYPSYKAFLQFWYEF